MRWTLMAAMAVVAGCAPRLYVNVLRPAPVNLGSAKKLTVVQSEGRLDARERVVRELIAQANAAGYFSVAEHVGAPAASDEIGLALSVLEYGATPDPASDRHSVWAGKIVLAVTATDGSGHVLASEKQYRGTITSDNGEDDALAMATRTAVGALLDDVTPSFARQTIELDEEDVGQRPIVELARHGDVRRAIAEERTRVAASPTAAGAFNLGALLDSQGEYAEALTFYDQAIKLAAKELYVETRGACARRLADVQALGHQAP